MSRSYAGESLVGQDGMAFALAPALTPTGVDAAPSFFHGFATNPLVLARGLVTLADITATRYFQFAPSSLRDPILTASGDRLRAECFSACNGVYARLDLLSEGFDGGDIGHGTTNVDLGTDTRAALSAVQRNELLHLDVGMDGLAVATLEATTVERPVQMPDRWVRALGNAAELHHGLVPVLTLNAVEARSFIAALPPATGATRSGWLTRTRSGVKLAALHTAGSVFLAGAHRLSGIKRVLVHVTGMTFYAPADGAAGALLAVVALPQARLTVGLTAEASRGYSGEGSLLASLAADSVREDADLVAVLLAFEPVIEVDALARDAALSAERVRAALAVLAASGRVGWDAHDQAYFHRELPDDPDRVSKDNPRLVAARALVAEGAVRPEPGREGGWRVASGGVDYLVRVDGRAPGPLADHATCSCAWYLRHTGGRGACKHVLAVQLSHPGVRP
ncbi:MAG: SWIM zinc finger family protein [Propionibacteriales bacterium]|nr:SWIM zinc finger family protein [Propionibacteriales bacterium]